MAKSKKTSSAKKATTANDTVVVALNNPTGITFSLSGHREVTINGNAVKLRGKEQGHLPIGGFGLTKITKGDWDEIQDKYGKMRVFKNGLCFATGSKSDTVDEADNRSGLRHGREPVAVDTPTTAAAASVE